eukprot:gene25643-11302_t
MDDPTGALPEGVPILVHRSVKVTGRVACVGSSSTLASTIAKATPPPGTPGATGAQPTPSVGSRPGSGSEDMQGGPSPANRGGGAGSGGMGPPPALFLIDGKYYDSRGREGVSAGSVPPLGQSLRGSNSFGHSGDVGGSRPGSSHRVALSPINHQVYSLPQQAGHQLPDQQRNLGPSSSFNASETHTHNHGHSQAMATAKPNLPADPKRRAALEAAFKELGLTDIPPLPQDGSGGGPWTPSSPSPYTQPSHLIHQSMSRPSSGSSLMMKPPMRQLEQQMKSRAVSHGGLDDGDDDLEARFETMMERHISSTVTLAGDRLVPPSSSNPGSRVSSAVGSRTKNSSSFLCRSGSKAAGQDLDEEDHNADDFAARLEQQIEHNISRTTGRSGSKADGQDLDEENHDDNDFAARLEQQIELNISRTTGSRALCRSGSKADGQDIEEEDHDDDDFAARLEQQIELNISRTTGSRAQAPKHHSATARSSSAQNGQQGGTGASAGARGSVGSGRAGVGVGGAGRGTSGAGAGGGVAGRGASGAGGGGAGAGEGVAAAGRGKVGVGASAKSGNSKTPSTSAPNTKAAAKAAELKMQAAWDAI